ncbi:MAG: TonB-dependent receptor [Magnetococcus sp. MYC-9]
MSCLAKLYVFCLLLSLALSVPAGVAAAETPAARLVEVTGAVEGRRADAEGWHRLSIGQTLQTGESIRTQAHSRAALLLADESLIKLQENSDFVIGEVAQTAAWTLLNEQAAHQKMPAATGIESQFTLHRGGAWFLNKNREVSIVFKTPEAHVGVRGTELVVQLEDAQNLRVAAIEGSAQIQNPQGSLLISSGEEAISQGGGAPVKRLLLHPERAVQWIITIPPLFTARDLRQEGPGWQALHEGRLPEALDLFNRSSEPASGDLSGRVATLMALQRFTEAGSLLANARRQFPGEPLFVLQQAWFDLLTGAVLRAHESLAAVTTQWPEEPIGWQLRTLTALVLDRRQEMQEAAQQAIHRGADSPTSWILLSYVHQAHFALDEAEQAIHEALQRQPTHLTALIALARLQFGGGRTAEALATLQQAIAQAPHNGELHNLHGYILFALRQDEAAIQAFTQAARQDPTLAEPHMGLGLTYMRQGETARAFEEITTAVLLEPRRALLRSYWAKMLYQISRHEKALDVLQAARTLDPRDPTPLLYEALILRDLNLPTQAIETLNQAIALNDNRGVYRSRFLLDGDLAVKNVDLSKLFNQLDMAAWAKNKAVASVRQDYTNASAHLFYAGALADEEGRSWARNTENLLARLLQPANMNTFNSFNSYTSFVEKPSLQTDLTLTVGSHDTLKRSVIVSGAAPKQALAYQVGHINEDSDGWRTGHFDHSRSSVGYLKWDASPNGSVMLAASQTDVWQGEKPSPRFEWDAEPSPGDRMESATQRLEGGYHHHFAPGSDLLLHAARLRTPMTLNSLTHLDAVTANRLLAGSRMDILTDTRFTSEFYQLQGLYIHKQRDNQWLAGAIHHAGTDRYHADTTLEVRSPVVAHLPLPESGVEQPRSMQTLFVQDILQLRPDLVVEGGLQFDRMENGSVTSQSTWNDRQWSPRLGMIWNPQPDHALRLAAFRSLLPFSGDRLDPADIAGVAIHRNGSPGSSTDEAQLVWEHENAKSFWSTALFRAERAYTERDAGGAPVTWESHLQGVELLHNRLLGQGLGLSARYRFEEVEDPRAEQANTVNRDEHLATVGVQWLDRSGWSAKARESYRRLEFVAPRADENIWLTDLELGYEWPNKRGSLRLTLNNAFNESFNWVTDPFIFQGRDPARELLLTVQFAL